MFITKHVTLDITCLFENHLERTYTLLHLPESIFSHSKNNMFTLQFN